MIQPSCRGNVLFLILIAVALFAALGYAITTSSRGDGGNIKRENMALTAAQVDSAISSYRQSVQRMIMASGIPTEQLDDSLPPHSAQTNAACTVNDCRIFSPEGGGVTPYRLTGADYLPSGDTVRTMRFTMGAMGNGVTIYGTTLLEVMSFLKVSQEFCTYFNKMRNYTGAIPSNSYDPPRLFEGTAFTFTQGVVSFWGALNTGGEQSGCQFNSNVSAFEGAGYYIFALMHIR